MDTQLTDHIPDNTIAIGEFARQTQLSLKALRLYHDKGLLVPAFIDRFSNYRYYAPQQVKTAQYIRMLREMDMPLTMIEQFLELVDKGPIAAATVLQSYLQLFDARVAIVHQTAETVSHLLEKQESHMQGQEQMLGEREVCLYDLPFEESHRLLEVLKRVLNATESVLSPDDYRLVGTTASILHGAKTPSKGVDILMRSRENVDAFHLAMSQFKVDLPPTFDPEDTIYWASYFVDGVHVATCVNEYPAESDAIESAGVGAWMHFTQIPWGHHSVPTVKLELRLITELFRNRPDRYEPLIEYMRIQKVDIDLLRRGMNERQIPQERQEEIIVQLRQNGD